MELTPEQLAQCTGATQDRAEQWTGAINQAMAMYDISTPARQAAFLAQIGHESGRLKYTTELWGPTPAQARYEGRLDLGNTQLGDGSKFRGHGLIQTTGRGNHARARDRLRKRFPEMAVPDFENDPKALAQPEWAALSAADYWDMRGLNDLADAGDFIGITKKINGGLNGLDDRLSLWSDAKYALGA